MVIINILIDCRLFNYAIGIHLLQSEDPDNMPKKGEINPKDNHISFQVKIIKVASFVKSLVDKI